MVEEFTRRTGQVRVASHVRVTSQVRVRFQIFFVFFFFDYTNDVRAVTRNINFPTALSRLIDAVNRETCKAHTIFFSHLR